MTQTVNCAVQCVNGCILGDNCPHKEHAQEASKFIKETSLDEMIELAEAARFRKMSEPPKWIIPDEI
jgi:hypothetical protein